MTSSIQPPTPDPAVFLEAAQIIDTGLSCTFACLAIQSAHADLNRIAPMACTPEGALFRELFEPTNKEVVVEQLAEPRGSYSHTVWFGDDLCSIKRERRVLALLLAAEVAMDDADPRRDLRVALP